jgi:hypothetical protein
MYQYGFAPWTINYKDTKTKCRHLKKLTCKGTLRQVFIKVYMKTGDTVSHVRYFDPTLWTYCPPNLLSASPPPFPVSKYSIRNCD